MMVVQRRGPSSPAAHRWGRARSRSLSLASLQLEGGAVCQMRRLTLEPHAAAGGAHSCSSPRRLPARPRSSTATVQETSERLIRRAIHSAAAAPAAAAAALRAEAADRSHADSRHQLHRRMRWRTRSGCRHSCSTARLPWSGCSRSAPPMSRPCTTAPMPRWGAVVPIATPGPLPTIILPSPATELDAPKALRGWNGSRSAVLLQRWTGSTIVHTNGKKLPAT